MANFDELLKQAATQPASSWMTPPVATKQDNLTANAQSKQDSVSAASASKQASLMTPAEFYQNSVGRETGQGNLSASPVEQDLRTLTPTQIYQKYGEEEGGRLITGQAAGNTQVLQDQTRGQRSALELWDDFNVDVAQGLGNTVGGLAGLAAAPISEDAGAGIASLLGDFNKFMDSAQSEQLQARKRLMEGKQSLDMRDNALQETQDQEAGKTLSGLQRVGRDVIDTLGNAMDDPATLGSGVSEALGSMVAVGPVSKALSAVSKGRAGTTAAIAATEAGGTYSQATQQVLDTPFSQLEKESPMFNQLVAEGATPEEARITVANRTGLLGAAITAPAAAVAGRLVSKFEGNPLAIGSGGVKQALANIGRETIEETVQSGAGQLAQNVAASQISNTEQALNEGVGRAVAEGGLYGMGMAGVMAAPNVAKSAGGKVLNSFAERAAGVDEANKKASPVSDETVAQAAAEVEETLPVAESVLREAAGTDEATNAYVDNLVAATQFTPEQVPAPLAQHFDGVTTKVDAVQRLAEIVNTAEDGSPDQLRAGYTLYGMMQDLDSVLNADPAALANLPEDSQARVIDNQFQKLLGAISSTPKVVGAIQSVMEMVEKAEAKKATVDAQTLATPEGQQDVADAIGVAEMAPEKGDLGTNEQILYQIEQGNLTVTPRQKAALDTSVALLRAVQAADQAAKANGQSDPVSLNIQSEEGVKGKSVVQHAKGIMSAWKSGDFDLAADRMTDLRQFAEGLGNKVAALNAHFGAGNPNADGLHYQTFAGGKPITSQSKMAVRSHNPNSVAFAQKVGSQAKLVADVFNGLAEAFPNLGAKHLAVVPLVADLNGPAAEVAARFAKPVVTDKTTPAATVPKQETAPAQKAEAKPQPAKAEPTQKVEEVKAEPVVEEETVVEPTETREPVRKGVAAAFPTASDTFVKAFKLPSTQRTRTMGDEAPVNTIRAALKDSASLTAFVGSSLKGNFTKEIASAYAGYLGTAEDFAGELDDRLQAFLDKPYSKGNPTTMREILAGAEVKSAEGNVFDPLRTPQGKALGITEEVDGETVYTPELIQLAVLAGMQWFLSSDQYGTTMDAKDLEESFGLSEGALDEETVDLLNQGMGLEEAARTLGSKIRGYWGVSANTDSSRGYTDGIAEGVAKELLEVMLANNWLTQETITLTEAHGLPAGEVRTPVRLIPTHTIKLENGKRPQDPLELARPFPDAIDMAVLLEPEDVKYIGEGAVPKVAQEQLRNPGVPNTAQQKDMMAKEQETPYFVQPVMAGLYMAMGRDAILRIFGAGAIDEKSMNKNHAQSMDGVNRSTVAAFDHLQNLLAEVANHGGEIDQIPIRYAVNMTRVNRMQMLGKYNPQSNKLVREAILPTQSTLDLSSENGQDTGRYMLGLAQLLDIKVHKMRPAASRAQVEADLSGALAPAVEALRSWHQGFDNSQINNPSPMSSATVDTIVNAFAAAKKPLSPMSLHAVMDYARYLNTDDKSAFNTSIYVEADGMTNGPIMAMNLFTTGPFKAQWIRNVAKGGVYFNQPNMSANVYNEDIDKNDLYQATTDELKVGLQAIRDQYANDARVTAQLDALFYLMDEFLGGDLQFSRAADGTPQLTLKRGIAKNPLTITIYGSGAGGIAAKMTKIVMDSVYERMSQVAQAKANGAPNMAEAMFGPQSASKEEAQARLQRFGKAFTLLTTNKAKMGKDGIVIQGTPVKAMESLDPVEFTLSADQWANMQSNMRQLFVDPMRASINSTVGEELMQTAEILRQATQAQSIVLEYAFKDAVEQALADKAKDPNWRKGDFLTIKEEEAIRKKLEHLSPLVQTETQNFYIAGSERADIKMTEFSRSLSGRLNTPAHMVGPKNAGVAGIPFMNIGAGDGQTMQNMSVDPAGPTGTLKIFDGVNMPLDQIESGSVSANKAAYEAMIGNPLAAVLKSYSQFMSDAKLTGMSEPQRQALSEALFGLGEKDAEESLIIDAMANLVDKLDRAQQEIEARHRVMDRVSVSIDQMAAANSPFSKEGDLLLVGTDPEALAEQMTAYYHIELERIRDEKVDRKMDAAFYELGTEHESGVVTMSGADIGNAIQFMPENQKAVLTEVANSLAAQDYTIILGNAQQVADYNNSRGIAGLSSVPSGAQGYTNVGTKEIVLLNPSSETFAHELVHAATYEAVDAHYAGETNAAVPRIEAMMEQFRKQASELSHTSQSLNAAYNSVLAAIDTNLAADNKAAALNEFMAWTLSNESLARVAQRTQVSKLARVKDKLISALKSLLGIKADAGKDMFSNLLFNSAILMHEQTKLSKRFSQSVLFQNSIYGNNERLTRINEALDTTVGRYLQEAPQPGRHDPQSAMAKGIQNGIRVAEAFEANGFPMTMQEASTFRTIVAALSTEAAIDPNAMAAAQQMYSHVMKNLKVESFMADPNSTDPAERYYAEQKYDVLSGKVLVTQDIKGRSSLLPAFLALATTNDGFRQILSNIDMPKSAHNTAGTLDAYLENIGNQAMDKLTARMAGQKKPANVVAALDQLNSRMADVINERETYIDQMASRAHGVMERSNELVMDGMDKLSAGLLKNAKRASTNAKNKLDRTVAGIGAGFAALINNTAAAGVAQDTMTAVNRSQVWTPVRNLIGDLVGRTASNANVYDMIKAVRSFVQRTRQQYRENLPELLNSKFSRELTDKERNSLHKSMGKTDLAALGSNALELAADQTKRDAEIAKLEKGLSTKHINKGKQLANYMVNGYAGQNLLRNAEAVARLLGENYKGPIADVNQVDQLVTLYALNLLSQEDKDILSSLVQDEAEGLSFSLDYLRGQRSDEQGRSSGMAKMNAFKGYIPNMLNEGMSMVVAHDSQYSDMLKQSYERVADYAGSPLERGLNRGYYFIPVASRGAYEQGIMQNVVQTAGGVNAATGLQIGQTAGAITEQADVKMLAKRMSRDAGSETLMPVYNEAGEITAFERALDPILMARLYSGNDLTKAIGIWRGRQVEEGMANEFNSQLIQNLKAMYDRDNDDKQYIDVFSSKDPVVQDAVKLFSYDTRAMIESTFGNKFMVRKDMLDDALGYRTASIGDMWTGNSRWSPETQKAVRNIAVSMMGNNAYKTLMNAEKTIQQVVADAKVLVVVKSVIVPAVNMISNVFQLAARGVPVTNIAKAMPKKLAEVEAYTRSLVRRIEAEAELRGAQDPRTKRKLETEIQSINDSHKRMSIWPLIEAGEFSGISDAGLTRGDIDLTSGRMQAYMESLVNKLPEKGRNLGRYALITKDTALFQGLQKAVEYGDFLAKATLYDDLTQRKGMSQAEALARITEEFVNYDRLSGRFRSSMEGMGLMWFYNFKIRSTKVALSMIRNNPVHTLLATLTPSPTLFGTVGLPTEDNMFSKIADGSIWRSLGPAQGFHAASLNPWYNLTQ